MGTDNDAKEKKSSHFIRLAEQRTARILNNLRLLSQLSNRRNYEYNEKQISKIFREIRRAVRNAESSFKFKDTTTEFKL